MTEPVLHFSEPCDKIAAALAIAQANMGDVKKNAQNPHFKSKYADLGAVLDAVWPALEKADITLLQPPAGRLEGEDYYVVIETVLLHKSGQRAWWSFMLPTSKHDPQGAGSAVTYARRYSVQSFFGLVPEDDDGNAASRTRPQNAAPAAAPPPARMSVVDQARFNVFTGALPEAEIEACIKRTQEHYRHEPTGQVADLYAGDEARDAFRMLEKKRKEFAGVDGAAK